MIFNLGNTGKKFCKLLYSKARFFILSYNISIKNLLSLVIEGSKFNPPYYFQTSEYEN